jgi:hypothetical protein
MSKYRDAQERYRTDSVHVQGLVNQLQEALGEDFPEMIALMRKSSKYETVVEGWCDECGGRARVRYPDWRAIIRVWEFWWDRAIGKPAQTVQHDHQVTGKVTLEAIQSMSDEELAGLASIDVEYRELPSPSESS